MRPPFPLLVWALAAVLLWASSLIPICGLLTLGYPHDHHSLEHPSPQDHKPPAPRPHDHLSDCPLCVVHVLQVTPAAQVPQGSLALMGLLLFAPTLRPQSAKFLLYFSRAPPHSS
ncbi:hypothetical protein [Calidithermus timidus]|jgi:hypothetical protein|uniref:hypothetical protein n=1 Tax=Calidithermus timidus TaxID=307124 RepID=UPI000367BA56|nr:hypothetical protein [Calidithermus timidus]